MHLSATVKLKSFPGHAGIPGHQGGSLPRGTYVGAKPLEEYMKVVNNSPWEDYQGYDGKVKYRYRAVPRDGQDASVYIGLANESRLCEQNYGMDFDSYVKLSEEEYRKQLEESGVYMRITPADLAKALQDEQFVNTFISKDSNAGYKANKTSYKSYLNHRVDGENEALGVPKNATGDDRPIYGYWSQNGGLSEESDTWLGQYGSIVVEFDKDAIADALTFTDSDSLDYSTRVRSSDWRHPSVLSSYGITNGSYLPDIAKRGPDAGLYWEAQIFNKSANNIKSVKSRTALPKSLEKLLEKAGIPWSIVS